MSDEDVSEEVEGGEQTEGKSAKKKSGLALLLPSLLKFVALGLAALVVIVTVAVITFGIMNKGGKGQTEAAADSAAYIGKRPEYAYFPTPINVRTRTRDPAPYSVVVELVIGYDVNDKNASLEMTNRSPEIRDFMRSFFSTKYAADLKPEREAQLKEEIVDALNTRVLDSSRAKIVLFNTFEVQEM